MVAVTTRPFFFFFVAAGAPATAAGEGAAAAAACRPGSLTQLLLRLLLPLALRCCNTASEGSVWVMGSSRISGRSLGGPVHACCSRMLSLPAN